MNGKGVLAAVKNVNERIAPKLVGLDPSRQVEIDRLINFHACSLSAAANI